MRNPAVKGGFKSGHKDKSCIRTCSEGKVRCEGKMARGMEENQNSLMWKYKVHCRKNKNK